MAAITSEATTIWNGELATGSGSLSLDSSHTASLPLTWAARAEGGGGANPEELLGAAHSACFSMALAHALTSHGTPPESIQATAAVTFAAGEGITGSHLLVSARVPGITQEDFERIAGEAKDTCPVSRALTGIPITMEAELA